MFSIVEIRPDIAFVTLMVSCFTKNPDYQHIKVIKILFKYFRKTKD